MSKVKQYDNLLKQMFELLDRTEESDSGATFKPITISCCRAIDGLQFENILIELKNLMKENIE
jgi:hypothetical protein